MRQSTSQQLELPVTHQLAGTDNLAPDNQRLAGTDRPCLGGLWPADTGHASVNKRPAGTDNLAPDNQRLAATGRPGLGCLRPADTRHTRLVAQK